MAAFTRPYSKAVSVVQGIPVDYQGKPVPPCVVHPNKHSWHLSDGSIVDWFVLHNKRRRLYYAGPNNPIMVPLNDPIAKKQFQQLSNVGKHNKIIELTLRIFRPDGTT